MSALTNINGTPTNIPTNTNADGSKPLTIGVFGGSFNPIHLGHALLAITTQQTCPVDAVVLVPVFKHAVKRDLLPFDDRVRMCELAVAPFGSALTVSTVERETGKSNGAMLRALKLKYPAGTKFVWICGDDFFRWMDRPAGLDTVKEVSGLIVQRRLHKEPDNGDSNQPRYFKEPVDETKIRAVAVKMNLEIHFIYGELPHFSSSLVRRAPGHWRSFLTQTVVQYLDARPHLLEQLLMNLEAEADAEQQEHQKQTKKRKTDAASDVSDSFTITMSAATTSKEDEQWQQQKSVAAASVLRGMEAVHALQGERGRAGLYLSMGQTEITIAQLEQAQANTDKLVQEILQAAATTTATATTTTTTATNESSQDFDEVSALDAELQRIPVWLAEDRKVVQKRCKALTDLAGVPGWLARFHLVQKFNTRIDVLIHATVRALTEILEVSHSRSAAGQPGQEAVDRDLPELLFKWCEGKEALGRLRAFVCAGGPAVPSLVHSSLKMRERLNQTIETKERGLARVLSLEAGMSSRLSAPDALHRLLENVSLWEWSLMGCFASSTPLALVHKLLDRKEMHGVDKSLEFDVVKFFDASSTTMNFLLTFANALAASACARA